MDLLWVEQDSPFIGRFLCPREPCARWYLLVLVSLSSLNVAFGVSLASLGKCQVCVSRAPLCVLGRSLITLNCWV
ncbi:hypothetical protein Hanom_Chr15g01383451 [Helianthus anomalus]